jgi:hypothetical protein
MSQITWEIVEVPEGEMLYKVEADGKRWAIPKDEANSDYQAYLNKDKPVEHFTPMVTDDPKP